MATLSEMPACADASCERRTFASVANAPANVSFASTLPSAVPPVRGAAPVSFTASMGKGFTVIATSAVSQLTGLAISQIRYVSVCEPGAVPTSDEDRPGGGVEQDPRLVEDT